MTLHEFNLLTLLVFILLFEYILRIKFVLIERSRVSRVYSGFLVIALKPLRLSGLGRCALVRN